jgi:hypothetical protein
MYGDVIQVSQDKILELRDTELNPRNWIRKVGDAILAVKDSIRKVGDAILAVKDAVRKTKVKYLDIPLLVNTSKKLNHQSSDLRMYRLHFLRQNDHGILFQKSAPLHSSFLHLIAYICRL